MELNYTMLYPASELAMAHQLPEPRTNADAIEMKKVQAYVDQAKKPETRAKHLARVRELEAKRVASGGLPIYKVQNGRPLTNDEEYALMLARQGVRCARTEKTRVRRQATLDRLVALRIERRKGYAS